MFYLFLSKHIFKIIGITLFLSIATFFYFKYIELKDLRINKIENNIYIDKLKNEIDLQYKIQEDMKNDFIYYQSQESISISKDVNISKSLDIVNSKYNFKTIFKKIKKYEGDLK